MERRFLISEDWGVYPNSWKDTITESELKQRLNRIGHLIIYGGGKLDCDWEVIFDILINSAVEKRE